MVFNKKVNCWFCNSESQVSVFKSNSWTCATCSQYNGFNRDGDYNKSINEMQDASSVNKKFCVSTTSTATAEDNKNQLCERCNRYQEHKYEELRKFEPKNENNFDAEFQEYKKKLEEIYDICVNCKKKVKQHLQQLDREIGKSHSNGQNCVKKSEKRLLNNVTNTFNATPTPKNDVTSRVGVKTSFIENNANAKKILYNKANTIAGTVTPYRFDNHPPQIPAQKAANEQSKLNNGKKTIDVSQKGKLTVNQDKKQSSSSNNRFYLIIVGDIVIFMSILFVFLSDLANLLNDSQKLVMNTTNKLIMLYSYSSYLLNSVVAVSFTLFLIRPKLSRFFITIGILLCSLIHSHVINMTQIEEQFVLELLSTFFLTLFLLIARLYNLIQAIAYIKNKTLNRSNMSVNQSISLNDTFNGAATSSNGTPLTEKGVSIKNCDSSKMPQIMMIKTPPNNKLQKSAFNLDGSPMEIDTSLNENSMSKTAIIKSLATQFK